jgi:hypothetical protein
MEGEKYQRIVLLGWGYGTTDVSESLRPDFPLRFLSHAERLALWSLPSSRRGLAARGAEQSDVVITMVTDSRM